MIIEIDIRIEDSDGKVLHRFENKYDDKSSAPIESQEYTDDAGMDFCDFLSEYLSCSGSLLRERLFQGNYTLKRDRYRRKGKKSSSKPSKETNTNSKVTHLENSELEYRIRIGDDKVLVGKIPLKLQSSTTSVTLQLKEEDLIAHQEVSNPSDNDIETDEVNNYPNEIDKTPDLQRDISTFNASDTDTEIDSILNYAMMKAIEKYELNLAPSCDA